MTKTQIVLILIGPVERKLGPIKAQLGPMVWATREGSAETARMRKLGRTFTFSKGYKTQIRLARIISMNRMNLDLF